MRVVLDTKVLLSALISPHGPPDVIYRAWRAARFEIVTSRTQLDGLRHEDLPARVFVHRQGHQERPGPRRSRLVFAFSLDLPYHFATLVAIYFGVKRWECRYA